MPLIGAIGRAVQVAPLRGVFVRILHLWFRLSRGMTLGVRIAAFDGAGRVALVRHSYLPGWHLPGGGVETGESALEAAIRELREEAGVAPGSEPLALQGVFWNRRASRRDHVLVFVARNATIVGERTAVREIAEAGFFALDALPPGTTPATLNRLEEIASGSGPASPYWS